MFHYLKFFLFHGIGLLSALFLTLGGDWMTYGFLAIFCGYVLLDAVLGDDISVPDYARPEILTWQLWLALPLLAFILFTFLWQVSGLWQTAAVDPLGYGALIQQLSGYDMLAARDSNSGWNLFWGVILTGLMIGMVGTITGHELTHRTWDPISMWVGRWLLAFSFDSNFAIEHVYGHHRYVSTTEDPATAPRGRNVYAHIVISTLRGNLSAWRIEQARLQKKRQRLFSLHNVAIRGYLMSATILLASYWVAGWAGVLFFSAAGVWGKALLEIVNYMEHYGMVRNPETPVQPRHSWNTNKRFSSWSMFNLTRHSHHHAQGEVPYHELQPYRDAPMMINGYLTTIAIALVPPLWHKLMTPKVLDWDARYASAEERRMATAANQKSGLKSLQAIRYDEDAHTA
ncbi:alkane 1-monooxygenase [Ketobacter sp.]|uniref:alkane 1-monooxygenase n=1 Tax=Ketobacter sp. TaxID=2083498 RepID=UPI000F2D436B|nr:alkane 1-monooxygenase [Ketobacter sp.]RLT95103.1 MAG: alkane 1-monooxygenase [Ketobacter sp.]